MAAEAKKRANPKRKAKAKGQQTADAAWDGLEGEAGEPHLGWDEDANLGWVDDQEAEDSKRARH